MPTVDPYPITHHRITLCIYKNNIFFYAGYQPLSLLSLPLYDQMVMPHYWCAVSMGKSGTGASFTLACR
jgi:hypothetical protein